MASQSDLTRLALRTLEDALAQAEHGRVIPQWSYRLALTCLTETWLSVKDQPIFAWAGLWRTSDEWGECYTGVMTSACSELAYIHDRSPVILEPHQWVSWLTLPLPSLYQFDRPYPATRMAVDATAELWARR